MLRDVTLGVKLQALVYDILPPTPESDARSVPWSQSSGYALTSLVHTPSGIIVLPLKSLRSCARRGSVSYVSEAFS